MKKYFQKDNFKIIVVVVIVIFLLSILSNFFQSNEEAMIGNAVKRTNSPFSAIYKGLGPNAKDIMLDSSIIYFDAQGKDYIKIKNNLIHAKNRKEKTKAIRAWINLVNSIYSTQTIDENKEVVNMMKNELILKEIITKNGIQAYAVSIHDSLDAEKVFDYINENKLWGISQGEIILGDMGLVEEIDSYRRRDFEKNKKKSDGGDGDSGSVGSSPGSWDSTAAAAGKSSLLGPCAEMFAVGDNPIGEISDSGAGGTPGGPDPMGPGESKSIDLDSLDICDSIQYVKLPGQHLSEPKSPEEDSTAPATTSATTTTSTTTPATATPPSAATPATTTTLDSSLPVSGSLSGSSGEIGFNVNGVNLKLNVGESTLKPDIYVSGSDGKLGKTKTDNSMTDLIGGEKGENLQKDFSMGFEISFKFRPDPNADISSDDPCDSDCDFSKILGASNSLGQDDDNDGEDDCDDISMVADMEPGTNPCPDIVAKGKPKIPFVGVVDPDPYSDGGHNIFVIFQQK